MLLLALLSEVAFFGLDAMAFGVFSRALVEPNTEFLDSGLGFLGYN